MDQYLRDFVFMAPPEGGAPIRVSAKDPDKLVELMLQGYKQTDPPVELKPTPVPVPAPKEVSL